MTELLNMAELPDVTIETIWAILNDELDDATTNALVWRILGYRQVDDAWDMEGVDPAWRETYPKAPPNFIESRPATVKLTRSIPKPDKQLLKEKLQFQGYKVGELVPRKTRRATIASYLLSYLNQQGQLS